MKFIISLFLLIITAVYVIPTKELLQTDNYEYCIEKLDTEKEEVEKKDKKKDFLLFDTNDLYSLNSNFLFFDNSNHQLQSVLHTVETPPPNSI